MGPGTRDIAAFGVLLFLLAPGTALHAQSTPTSAWIEVPEQVVEDLLVRPFEGPCAEEGLPVLEGFPRGNVRVQFMNPKFAVDTIRGRVRVTGTIIDGSSQTALPGIRLVAGMIRVEHGRCVFVPEAGTITTEEGAVTLTWNGRPGTVLLATMLGRLEAAWTLGPQVERGRMDRRDR
jgi:hypothetical protein